MTWGFVAKAGAVVVGAYTGRKARKSAEKEGRRNRAAAKSAGELLEIGYQEAEGRLSPFIKSETAANLQLMIEMGLTPDFTEDIKDSTAYLDDLRQQLSEIEGRPIPEQFGSDAALLEKFGFEDSETKGRKGLRGSVERARAQSDYVGGQAEAKELRDLIAEEEELLAGYQQQQDQPQGQPGTAYMQTPAYQAAIDQGVAAVDQGAATGGSLYSGRRGEALKDVGQGVQQSYYSNYMNILQNMANPTSATNLSNIGIDKAGTIGSQNIAAQEVSSKYNILGQEAQGAAMSDIFGGISSGISAYMNRPQTPPPPQVPPQATQTSTIPASSSAWM